MKMWSILCHDVINLGSWWKGGKIFPLPTYLDDGDVQIKLKNKEIN